MKTPLDAETYYATVEVDGEWARGTVSQIFAVVDTGGVVGIINGWVIDDTHPHGLLLKALLAVPALPTVENPATYSTGHCFIPWRYVRYVAYLEYQTNVQIGKVGFA